jgi:hypothetical protein
MDDYSRKRASNDALQWRSWSRPAALTPVDAWLPAGATARLVSNLAPDKPLVLSVKAGHNDEQHNHNDIGSFLLHAAGENVLTDPGRGLYSRDYFRARHYENVFANSSGHSVPRIDGALQRTEQGQSETRRAQASEHYPPTRKGRRGCGTNNCLPALKRRTGEAFPFSAGPAGVSYTRSTCGKGKAKYTFAVGATQAFANAGALLSEQPWW